MKKKEQENPVKGGTIGPDLPDLISFPDPSLKLAMHRCIADPHSDVGQSDREISPPLHQKSVRQTGPETFLKYRGC